MRQLRLRDLFAIVTIAALVIAWLQAERRVREAEVVMGKQVKNVQKQFAAIQRELISDHNNMLIMTSAMESQLADLRDSLAKAERASRDCESRALKYEFAKQRVWIKVQERELASRKKHFAPQQPLVQPVPADRGPLTSG